MLIVRAYPRLHVGLLDLGLASSRKYGGAGFTLSGPVCEVSAEGSRETRTCGLDKVDGRTADAIDASLERLRGQVGSLPISINLLRVLPSHVGLGSKTAVILAVLEAANRFLGLGLEDRCIQQLSGRGGTSGIGVNSFFVGGFLTDAGHSPQTSDGYLPSGTPRAFEVPKALVRLSIPASWRFDLFAHSIRGFEGGTEVAFFQSNTPIPRDEVLEAVTLMYHGIAPAVLLGDLHVLKRSLRDFHRVGFKSRELHAQQQACRAAYDQMEASTAAAVGLSSVGPLLYAVTDHATRAFPPELRRIGREHGLQWLGVFRGRNRGYQVLHCADGAAEA